MYDDILEELRESWGDAVVDQIKRIIEELERYT